MKRLLLLFSFFFVLFLIPAFYAEGAIYTGSISTADGTLIATEPWDLGSSLSWEVTNEINSPYWSYTYTFTVPEDSKEISHLIIEVSGLFTAANIIGDPPGNVELSNFGPGKDNPGMPHEMAGLKWDELTGYTYTFSITSDRVPMWGNFYAKDGKLDGPDDNWVYAFNSGFASDGYQLYQEEALQDGALIKDGKAWIMVPNTHVVPVPASVLLLGSGVIGLVGLRRWRGGSRKAE